MKILSWNTRGYHMTEVKALIGQTNFPEIVFIQEAGVIARADTAPEADQISSSGTIEVLTSTKRQLYFFSASLHPYADNPRCTTAMMVRCDVGFHPIREASLGFEEIGPKCKRPPVGVILKDGAYAGMHVICIHAIAAKSPAQDQVIDLIKILCDKSSGRDWVLGGDLNQKPKELQALCPHPITVSYPNSITHDKCGTLDFFVHSRAALDVRVVGDKFTVSDHLPIITAI